MLNMRAIKKNQFVGTRVAAGLSSKANNKDSWERLHRFALKYAPVGCEVAVYCLGLSKSRPVSSF